MDARPVTTARLVPLPVRQGTEAWLEHRMEGVSSSDIPILTGNRPGLLTLWAVKARLLDLEPPDDQTQQMFDIGHLLEDDLAELYTRQTDRPLRRVNRMVRHPEIAWAFASLDRVSAIRGETRIAELKWAPHRRWSEGAETIPASVQDQIQWQLLVTGYEVADVGVLEGSRFAIHEVGRDDGYIDDLLYIARHFRELVETQTRPDVDGSIDTHRALGRLYPRAERDVVHLFIPDPTFDDLANRLYIAQRADSVAKAELSAVKAAIKALLAESAGVESEPFGYRITLTNNRVIDWQGVVHAILASIEGDGTEAVARVTALIEEHTHTDWRKVAETLRPRRKLIDAHATPDGPRVLRAKFRNAPPDEAGEEEAPES